MQRFDRYGWIASCLWIATMVPLQADGPADNQTKNVRPVPPSGMAIPEDKRSALEASTRELAAIIATLRESKEKMVQEFLPDVEIFYIAVDRALREDGFFEPSDVDHAEELLRTGKQRAVDLANQKTPWRFDPRYPSRGVSATVRGFRSQIDGSIQPYGVVMNSFGAGHTDATNFRRADVWCRGRSEKGLELQFLSARMKNFDPVPDSLTMMIHPFGRYCNANKLAGEIDTLEALEHAIKEYGIHRDKIAIRGFSMGGAAAWHLAVHYPDRWFAATPGAGFSETPEFLNVFQSETLAPTWYEQKLWQLYDCPVWVRNLRMLPTIAYSGAIDKQKQAADVMARASWQLPDDERFEMAHIVAPNTGHQITTAAREEIDQRLRTILDSRTRGAPDAFAFTTTSLRYNKAHWLTVDALVEHWVPSSMHVRRTDEHVIVRIHSGIQQFSLNFTADALPTSIQRMTVLILIRNEEGVEDTVVWSGSEAIQRRSDLSWGATFRATDGTWKLVSPVEPPDGSLKKKHLLQGPIDDAFMAPFLMVRPSADGMHPNTAAWVQSEFDRAVREWHRQMRGDVRIKAPEDVTPEDMQRFHLVLWGDPVSNPLIAKIQAQLPIGWTKEVLQVGERSFDASAHMPVLIYPNPLSPERYVVLNSSFTYREYDYLNNARQVPKLPDWAVIDLKTPPDRRWPGRIADADFFDEQWQLKPKSDEANQR